MGISYANYAVLMPVFIGYMQLELRVVIAAQEISNSIDLDGLLAIANQSSSKVIELPGYGGLLVDKSAGNVTFKATHTGRHNLSAVRFENGEKILRIVTMIEPPFVNYVNLSDEAMEENRIGPGIAMEILKAFQKKYEISYEFITLQDQVWGEPDGRDNWSGLFGMVQRNEADLLAGAAIVRYDRYRISDLSYPFYASETGMLIRSPARFTDSRFLIVTAPFSWQVWMVAALAVFVSGLILKGLCIALDNASEVQYTVWGAVWVFFSVFVQQALPTQPKSLTCRTLLAFWWLAALTLAATFTGNMVALFAVNRLHMPFKTQEEMVQKVVQENYKVVLTTQSLTRLKFIQSSELQLFRTLWYEMSVNKKWINVSSLDEGIRLVKLYPNLVLLGPKETLDFYASSDCEVTTLEKGLIPVMYSFVLQRKSNYTEWLSAAIRDLVEMGFVNKWLNDYQFFSNIAKSKCTDENANNAGEAIDINRAQGAFWILVAGTILGVFCFGSEMIAKFIKQSIGVLRPMRSKSNKHHFDSSDRSHPKLNGPFLTNFNSSINQIHESAKSYRPTYGNTYMVTATPTATASQAEEIDRYLDHDHDLKRRRKMTVERF